MADLLHQLQLAPEAHDLDIGGAAFRGVPDGRRIGGRRQLDAQQPVMTLDRADLADRGQAGQHGALMGLRVAGLGQPDPARVAMGRLAAEERHPGRVRTAPREAGQHVQHDPSDGLGVVPLR